MQFAQGGLPAEKLFLKPNFVDPDPGPGAHDGGFALFVGRITPEKGAVQLARNWVRAGIEMPLHIAGTGPEEPALRASAGDGENVKCLGFVDKARVTELMKQAAFLVFPSTWYEGLPLTIVEALAVGLPVVSARLGSMSTLIRHEETGLHYAPDDESDAMNTLRRAAGSPDLMHKLGAAARKEYLATYTADKNYEMLMDIYERARQAR
jgi:glycosyltransferase involved in cell wall biosynthesis